MQEAYRPSVLLAFNGAAILFTLALTFFWAGAIGFHLPEGRYVAGILIVFAVMVAFGLFYALVRKDAGVAQALFALATIQLFVPVAGALSYLGTTVRMPMADAVFARIDTLMGLDWVAMVHASLDYPVLISCLQFLYAKPFALMPFAIIALLFLSGRAARLEELAGFVIISTLVTIAIGAVLPALSAYAYYDIPSAISDRIGTTLGRDYGETYAAIRNGIDNRIDMTQPRALIAFPSYHTVVAVMLSIYVRHNRWLLAFMVPVSAGIVASTPLLGGHYFIDVLGGLAVAWFSFAAVRRLAGLGWPARAPQAALIAP